MARFVCNEYGSVSVTNLLKNLSWPTLQQRRICNRGIMLYKILNKQVEIPITSTIFRPNISSTRGNNRRFIQLQCHLDCYNNSFFPDAIRIWNSLPQKLIDSPNVELFRYGIYRYYNCKYHIIIIAITSALYIYGFALYLVIIIIITYIIHIHAYNRLQPYSASLFMLLHLAAIFTSLN